MAFPLVIALFVVALGCHKKEVAPPPPPPPPPAVEKKPEAVKVDSTEILARMRAQQLAMAKQAIEAVKVYFDFDKSDVKAEFRSSLQEIARVMKEQPSVQIRIEGNCDERGTEAYNLALGERRANTAKQFLVDAGVDASRINTKSWGKDRPVAACNNESCWSQNRRDDFFVE
jgi:peptidoglycan-associated lipoprotein